jgi:hypothetical protein
VTSVLRFLPPAATLFLLLASGPRNTFANASESSSCLATINSVASEMKRKGALVKYSFDYFTEKYFDLTPQGALRVEFVLGTMPSPQMSRANGISANIMSSPVLQAGYAKRIFSECRDAGGVGFGLSNTDWGISYLFTSAGDFLEMYCSHDRKDPKFNLRATFVYHPAGRSLDGSCTYIYVNRNR